MPYTGPNVGDLYMSRKRKQLHRRQPARRQRYDVDISRGIAVILEDGPDLANLDAAGRRLLEYMLRHALTDGHPERMPEDEFIPGLKELYANGFIGIMDGRAYPSIPEPRPDGTVQLVRAGEGFGPEWGIS